MKRLKEQLKGLDKNFIKFLGVWIGILYITFLYFNNLNIEKENLVYWILFFVAIVIETGVLIFLHCYNKKQDRNIKIEKIFLPLIIGMGILYMIAIPIGKVPDEKAHFLRAYEISKGHIVSQVDEDGKGGCDLPSEIEEIFEYKNYNQVGNMLFEKPSGIDKHYQFSGSSLYSFVVYIPQVIGILIGRLFNSSILITAYLARLFNFIFSVFIIYYAIKLMPCYKKFFMMIVLLPITLQQIASISADGLTISLCFLLISYIMNLAFNNKKEKIEKSNYAVIAVLSIIVSLCKITYMPLVLLTLLIPKEKFGGTKNKYTRMVSITIISVVVNFIWLIIASRYLVEFNPGVNSAEQVEFVLKNPFMYISTLFYTICQHGVFYIVSSVGQSLELFSVNLSSIYSYIIILLLFNACYEKNDIKISKYQRNVIIGVFVIIVLLIFTALYVQWTPVGERDISGVQGRYFIPIITLLPMFFIKNNDKQDKDKKESYNGLIMTFLMINLYAISKILLSHII